MKVTNAYVAGDVMHLAGRTDDGSLVWTARHAERSIFVHADDLDVEFRRKLREHPLVSSMSLKGPWVRIIVGSDKRRPDTAKNRRAFCDMFQERGIETYEGDVGPVRRYLADTGLQVGKPRRAYIDFEADSRFGFAFGRMRAICWTVTYEDGTFKQGVLSEDSDEGERILLQEFWEAIEDVEQVCAWNGDRFDFPFLEARTEARGIFINRRRWLWMDMMLAYQRLGRSGADGDEKESVALEATSQVVLGEGKTEVPDFVRARFGDLSLGRLSWELWNEGGEFRDLLLAYNRRDADLMRRIEGKIGVLAMHDAICQACQVLPDSHGLKPTEHVEGFMLRLGAEKNIHFRTRKRFDKEEEDEEKFRGAYVMEPQIQGIASNVHVGDFSSMYPSIILTWNLSPETKDLRVPAVGEIPADRCRAPETMIGFRTDVHGLLPEALRTMLKLRKEWSDKKASLTPGTEEWIDAGRRSDGYKIAANSFYGVLGNKYSRFYDRDVAESVSTTGAWLIKEVMKEAKARGFVPVYGDTDSNFIGGVTRAQFAEFIEYLNKEAFPRWAKEQGCVECHLKIAYEKAFESIFFLSKKRYAGRYAHYKGKEATADSKPEVRGLEYRRGDTGRLARALQKEIVYKILGVGQEAILDPVFYDALVRKWQEKVLDGELDASEATFSHSLTKELDEYISREKKGGGESALPPHVQVGKILRDRGQNVYSGMRIIYYVKDGSSSPTKYAPGEDYKGDADRYYLWEKRVWPPAERVLTAVFPGHDWTKFSKVRPKRPRGPKNPNQLTLDYGEKNGQAKSI